MHDYGEKSEKPLSSLLVFLNDWLNFRVRDQFEIKMLIARGHSDINTTLSVIMSLFCCRSLCLCISLSRCLCLFILAVSFCLPAFFPIIFSPSSRSDSFYLLSFFQNQLRDIIVRRCAMRFPAKKSLLSPTPRVHADYFPLPRKSLRTDVRYVITKFSGMDSLPNFLTHGAPLGARGSSAKNQTFRLVAKLRLHVILDMLQEALIVLNSARRRVVDGSNQNHRYLSWKMQWSSFNPY